MARGTYLSPENPVFVAGNQEAMRYAGSTIILDHRDICVRAPGGDIHFCTTMPAARKWARDHRKRTKGENHVHSTLAH